MTFSALFHPWDRNPTPPSPNSLRESSKQVVGTTKRVAGIPKTGCGNPCNMRGEGLSEHVVGALKLDAEESQTRDPLKHDAEIPLNMLCRPRNTLRGILQTVASYHKDLPKNKNSKTLSKVEEGKSDSTEILSDFLDLLGSLSRTVVHSCIHRTYLLISTRIIILPSLCFG